MMSKKRRRRGFGRYQPFEWRGQKLETVFAVKGVDECAGSTEWIKPVPGYDGIFGFTGWILHSVTDSESPDWIIAVDPKNRIVGFGAPGRRFDLGSDWFQNQSLRRPEKFVGNLGFAGYLLAFSGTKIRFLSIKDNQACAFKVIQLSD